MDKQVQGVLDYPDCCIGCAYAYKNETLQIDCACMDNPPPNCHLNKDEEMDKQEIIEEMREKIAEIFFEHDYNMGLYRGQIFHNYKECPANFKQHYRNKADQILSLVQTYPTAYSGQRGSCLKENFIVIGEESKEGRVIE